jgi:hypothetical protein
MSSVDWSGKPQHSADSKQVKMSVGPDSKGSHKIVEVRRQTSPIRFAHVHVNSACSTTAPQGFGGIGFAFALQALREEMDEEMVGWLVEEMRLNRTAAIAKKNSWHRPLAPPRLRPQWPQSITADSPLTARHDCERSRGRSVGCVLRQCLWNTSQLPFLFQRSFGCGHGESQPLSGTACG